MVLKYQVSVRRGKPCLMVRLGSLALVSSLPRDSVSIKILLVLNLKFTNPKNMSVMSNQSFSMYGVKETGTIGGEGISSGSCLTEQ